MRSSRLLVSAAVCAVVAAPGFALAQAGGPPDEIPPVEVPTPTETETEEPLEVDEIDEVDEVDEVDADELKDDELEDDGEGNGEVVSALAQCLPGGADLHGTGLTKGSIMSQAASMGEVVLGAEGEALPVTTVEEAEALCEVVADLAETAEAPETAKGRPWWAGPKDEGPDDGEESVDADSGDEVEESTGGRPAGAGKGKGSR